MATARHRVTVVPVWFGATTRANTAMGVACVGGRKNLGDADRHIRESPYIQSQMHLIMSYHVVL